MNEGKRILVNDLVTSNCANYKTCLFVHLVFLSEVFGDMQVAVAHISIKLLSYEKLLSLICISQAVCHFFVNI